MKNFTLADGRKFSWLESGCGAPLILIHGWGSSSIIFSELIEHLPQYRCLAPDLPGYGESASATSVDLDILSTDLLSWFDELGYEVVNLVGWSLGGILAQQLALQHPTRVNRLILISTTPRFVTAPDWPHGLADVALRSLARDFSRAPVVTLDNFSKLQFQGERTVHVSLLPAVEMDTALGGLELLRKVDLRGQLNNISAPTLVLHGSDDVIIPIAAGRFLASAIPRALFCEISGCGHAPFRSNIELFSTSLGNFLS